MIKPVVIESNDVEQVTDQLKAAIGIARMVQLSAEELGVVSGGLDIGHPTGKVSTSSLS